MKASALKYAILSLAAIAAMVILAVVPLHAFLTVWLSSLVGHYTALRLWKEVLLLIMGLAALYLLFSDEQTRTQTLTRRLVWLIVAYAGLQVVIGITAYQQGAVTLKALAYGWLIDLRPLGFFLLTWAVALRTNRLKSREIGLLLWPAAFVVGFGLLQIFILPSNFLTHFGYGPDTIKAVETVNNNNQYVRIASTLRGANPLGAYLIIPLSMLSVLLAQRGPKRRQLRLAGFLLASLTVLGFSFSRSAWIGAIVATVLAVLLGSQSAPAKKQLLYGLAASCLLLLITGLSLQHSTRFQNVFFHTQVSAVDDTSSNEGHLKALQTGLSDVGRRPLGQGPGTAGPASFYNQPSKPRIAENYYLQLAQEVGVFGLALFVLINAGVGYLLWTRRAEPLARALLASFIGLTVVNMLSHAWADDTLAYVWWGLAGIALARLPIIPLTPATVTGVKHKA